MSTTVATLKAVFTADTAGLDAGIGKVKSGLAEVERGASQAASSGNAFLRGLLDYAVIEKGTQALTGLATATLNVDSSMRNIQAVTGATDSEIAKLRTQVVGLSRDFTATPQEAAAAYYDIAGGVTDASARMSVFEESMRLADAGQANLAASTSALIAVVNGYGAEVLPAARASDILTRTVGMGVGTMDEFAAALPQVTGLAAATGVEFENVAASMAYMTTKGYSASTSAARLQAVITAVLKPNQAMTEALKAAGIQSGSFALENYGLAGTLGRLQGALGGSTDALSEALGTAEALQAAVALNEAEFESFITTFESGIDGATSTAFEEQSKSVNFQLEKMKGNLEAIAVTAGSVALPTFSEGMTQGNWMIDVIFPGPEEIAAQLPSPEDIKSYLTPSQTSVSYTLQAGDTAQDVADALGVTVQEAQRLMREQGAFVSVALNPTLDGFASALGTSREDAQRIADEVGWNVIVPTTVTAEMVTDELAQRGLGSENFEAVRQELEAQAASGVTVNIPTRITPQIIQDVATARGVTYAQAEQFLNGMFENTAVQTRVGTVITTEVAQINAPTLEMIQAAYDVSPETQALSAGDERLALAVAAVVAVGEVTTGEDWNEIAVFEALQSAVDGLPPIELSLSEILIGAASVVAAPGLAKDIYDAATGFANLISNNQTQEVGLYKEYSNNAIGAPYQTGMFDYMYNPMREGQQAPMIPNFGGVTDPATAFVNAVLGEESTPGMDILLEGGTLPTASASVDMTQPNEEFNSFLAAMNEALKPRTQDVTIRVAYSVMGDVPPGLGSSLHVTGVSMSEGIPGYAEGTPWTGGGGLAMLHHGEGVVPNDGILVKPSPSGWQAFGGGGGGININGPITITGVQNVQQLFDQLQQIGRERGR